MGVAIGVDSHKSSLAVGVLDEIGRVVGVREFTNDERGHELLINWARGCGSERVIGIEGSGSYGAGLARALRQAGEDVREVPRVLGPSGAQEEPLSRQVRRQRCDSYRAGGGSRDRVVITPAHRDLLGPETAQ